MIVLRNPERILSNMTVYQVILPPQIILVFMLKAHIEVFECICCVVGIWGFGWTFGSWILSHFETLS